MEAEVRAGRYFGREEDKEKTFAEFLDRYIEKELPKTPNGYKKQKMMPMGMPVNSDAKWRWRVAFTRSNDLVSEAF